MYTVMQRPGHGQSTTAPAQRTSPAARAARLPILWASSARVWLERHPLAIEAVVPLVLAAGAVIRVVLDHQSSSAWTWPVLLAVVGPLALRRRHPLAVFAAVGAAALLAAFVIAPELAAFVTLAQLIALFRVAASHPRTTALICAGLTEVWAILALAHWAPSSERLSANALMAGTLTAAVMIGVNLQTRRAYLAALEDRAARLERERDQQARLAVAQERARIARDVHDIVTHSLSVMVALADGAAATASAAPERAGAVMGQVADTGRKAMREMRRMLGTLRADEPEAERHPQPGIAQLDDLLAEVRTAGLPALLTIEGAARELDPGAQLAVYRIAQESLTNIRKHADEPGAAWVRLRYLPGAVELEIVDHGRAREHSPSGAGIAGHGITGMRERAAIYGGSVDAGPVAGGGWRVRAHLPWDDAEGTR